MGTLRFLRIADRDCGCGALLRPGRYILSGEGIIAIIILPVKRLKNQSPIRARLYPFYPYLLNLGGNKSEKCGTGLE